MAPAQSEAQRNLMALAEHNPSKVSKKNRGVLSMSHQQLHDFAATKGLTKGAKDTLANGKRKGKK